MIGIGIGKLICWWKKEHKWTDPFNTKYYDDRTEYWMKICTRCAKRKVISVGRPE